MAKRQRVLLKISGEALMGDLSFGISQEAAACVADKIYALHKRNIQVAVVIGGGNIFRGVQQMASWGMDRTPADQAGMLATLMNGLALSQALCNMGAPVSMMSALECPSIAENFHWEKAMRYLDEGRILLFVGGTGHPYFTTDTTAALRACEIKADIFLKATTRVDGIYDKDPRTCEGAVKFSKLSFLDVLERKLRILDLTAITLCMDAQVPIRVFNFYEGSLWQALTSDTMGTLIN